MFDGDSPDPLAVLVSTEAEQALLGALLMDNRSFEYVADLVTADDFGLLLHARLFEAIAKLVSAGQKVDPVVLKARFDQDPDLKGQLTGDYLAKLVMAVVTIANAPSYARTIADLSRRRDLVMTAQDLLAEAANLQDPDRSAIDVIEAFEQQLYRIGNVATNGGPEAIASIARNTILEIEARYKAGGVATVDTGLAEVDNIIGGMGAGDLIVLGGRPSMGKTALAGTIIFNVANRVPPKVPLIFSLEMTKGELVERWLAGLTGIETERQRLGRIREDEWPRLVEAQQFLAGLPIAVDDQARLSVAQMRQRARRHKRRFGLSLIVVDHLQLVRQGGKVENRRLEIGDATSSLKAVAKELEVPVLVLSQLSRAVEQREDRRPILSDLRESGDIEQDSDVVMFLYREEYYLERMKMVRSPKETIDTFAAREAAYFDALAASRGLAEILIPKNRHGRTGVATVAWRANRQRFENLARTFGGVDAP